VADRFYKLYCYWRIHGTIGLTQFVLNKLAQKLQRPADQLLDLAPGSNRMKAVAELSHARFHLLTPLCTSFITAPQTRRVSIVTDSVSSSSLFGGVGTALIFGALLANALNAQLRIITRTERAKPENVDHLLSLYGITLEQEILFKFAAFYDEKYEIDCVNDELFITTSWWTTAAALPSVPNDNILYLLQEDERMFYPFGDDRLKCETILRNRNIRFLINTKLLFNHFIQDGFENIAAQASWFEPAFPKNVFRPGIKKTEGKRRFFFYARPNNPRNLFYLGIDVIEQAILQHVLDPDIWEICLVGKDIPSVSFSGGYAPTCYETMAWSDYAELLGTIDLGLSLMYTPHPSYPPLDLVASGAVVVTNSFAGKQDLSGYSSNLICADLDRDALVDALRRAVALALDLPLREQNYCNNGLLTDWCQAFDGTINAMVLE
jgi:O-antigen biosynthesis protein